MENIEAACANKPGLELIKHGLGFDWFKTNQPYQDGEQEKSWHNIDDNIGSNLGR